MGITKPTPERPCRSVASKGNDTGSVVGMYQAVVQLPKNPTKRDELLAFAEAAESLAQLARKWAELEKPTNAVANEEEVRVDVTMAMRREVTNG